MKANFLFKFALALCALSSCTASHNNSTLSGVLETDDLDIIAPFIAQILSINVREGALIHAGALLADMEAGSDVEKIRAAEARLRLAEETLAQTAKGDERASCAPTRPSFQRTAS